MSNILIKSTEEIEEIKKLLAKDLPSYRKAYSDRTSWLMAFISELAYIRFNPIFKDSLKEHFIKQVSKLVANKDIKALNTLIEIVGYDADEEKKKLEENVKFLNLKLIKTFDNNGTQAILLENDTYIFLGFRGTEATSMKDIKSDVKATIKTCKTGGKIHSGFDEAFSQVAVEIQQFLNQDEFKDKPLFITGHSLGGALATVAAKKLTHKGGIASCYTFGSPRVGNVDWATGIKTPIYRIVNAVDPVTMLPPSGVTIELSSWVLGFIPYAGSTIKKILLSKFGGYYHCGNMRYLSICKAGNYNNVKLLYSVSFIFRARAFFKNSMPGSKIPADHSITVYRNKLKVIASNRNKDT
ncbi:MAG: lipase family protein [Methylococcales bacterium]